MITMLSLALLACGAAPNPRPVGLPAAWTPPEKPAARTPPEKTESATQTGDTKAQDSGQGAADKSKAGADKADGSATKSTSSPGPGASPGPGPSAGMPGLTIATVAGKPIDVSELLAQWVHQSSSDAFDHLDHLVLSRLVKAEAQRLSLRIEPERSEKAYAEAVTKIESGIGKKRPGVTLDKWVDQVLGLDPYVYRERLRDDALRQLLAERVTRAFTLQSERAEVRVIVVMTEGKVKEVQAALAAGEAFEAVARRLSADPSAKDGGRVPSVIRSETAMGLLAFSTKVGEVSDPSYQAGAWLIAKVDARPAPIEGLWPDIAATVEKSLAEHEIEDIEYSQWRGTMLRRYQVDIAPFLRLAGEPGK